MNVRGYKVGIYIFYNEVEAKEIKKKEVMMEFEDFWDNLCGLRVGPFRMGASYGPGRVRYSRTSDSHILSIRISPDIKKEEIKVRLMKPGFLEIEWPRKIKGEEIPVE